MAWLIVGRVVQGIGAAAFLTVGMAMINVAFSARRPWAFGIYLLAANVAGAAGPFLGGAILQVFGWRTVFLVLIPIAGVAAAVQQHFPELFRPDYRDSRRVAVVETAPSKRQRATEAVGAR